MRTRLRQEKVTMDYMKQILVNLLEVKYSKICLNEFVIPSSTIRLGNVSAVDLEGTTNYKVIVPQQKGIEVIWKNHKLLGQILVERTKEAINKKWT